MTHRDLSDSLNNLILRFCYVSFHVRDQQCFTQPFGFMTCWTLFYKVGSGIRWVANRGQIWIFIFIAKNELGQYFSRTIKSSGELETSKHRSILCLLSRSRTFQLCILFAWKNTAQSDFTAQSQNLISLPLRYSPTLPH